METSLHRQLKAIYAGASAATEVRHGRWRIDAVADGELVEVQHAGLAAIRDKIAAITCDRRLRVVKPIVASKLLVKLPKRGARPIERRLSPKRGGWLDLFDELVYLTRVFPHPNLVLEAVLVDVEEWRRPGHGRRRRWRRNDHVVVDQKLLAARERIELTTADDLWRLVDCDPPRPFHTLHLAQSLGIARARAQRIAYCLHRMGAATQVGKLRRAWLYEPKREQSLPARAVPGRACDQDREDRGTRPRCLTSFEFAL